MFFCHPSQLHEDLDQRRGEVTEARARIHDLTLQRENLVLQAKMLQDDNQKNVEALQAKVKESEELRLQNRRFKDEREPLFRAKIELNEQLTELSTENAKLKKENSVSPPGVTLLEEMLRFRTC